MIHLTFALTARVYYWLQDHAPTNRWVNRLRANPTLKGSAASLALGLACLIAAATLSAIIRDGLPAWWNLVVVWLALDGIKLVLLAPTSLLWAMRAGIRRPTIA